MCRLLLVNCPTFIIIKLNCLETFPAYVPPPTRFRVREVRLGVVLWDEWKAELGARCKLHLGEGRVNIPGIVAGMILKNLFSMFVNFFLSGPKSSIFNNIFDLWEIHTGKVICQYRV